MATQIQESMLPNIFPAFPDRKELDIYASMKPAKEVGGDFYDFFFIEKDLLGMVVADVSGKGVPAALFMMASKILVQNLALVEKDPKLALEMTNEQICKNNQGMFVTMWLGIIDLKTGILTASNAGHEFPIIKQPNGKFELFKDKHGLVIGAYPDIKYTSYQIKIEKGGMLFVYTDGVAEATNREDEQYGLDRIVDTLNNGEINNPTEALKAVDKSVSEFVGDAPQFDDLTMLCFKYNGK
jgi:sigma-B regulation protein RsbU (phosphoserine phosphatase)